MTEAIVLTAILVAIFRLCKPSKVDKDIAAIREQLEAAAQLKAVNPEAALPIEELTQALDAYEKRKELGNGPDIYDDPTAVDGYLPPLLRS